MITGLLSIISACTPFLAVFIGAGVVYLACTYRRKDLMLNALIFCVIGMVVWRIAMGIISSRYATILLIPGILITATLCFKLPDRIPGCTERIRKILRFVLLIGVPIALFGKTFHFNPYQNSMQELCAIAQQDARKYPDASIVDLSKNIKMTTYYSGLAMDWWCQSQINRQPEAGKFILHQNLKLLTSSNLVLYIFNQEEHLWENLAAQDWAVELPGHFSRLGERYVNRKKRKKWVLYRYEANFPEKQLLLPVTLSASNPPAVNLLLGGEFESVEKLVTREKACRRYREAGLSFYENKNKLIPEFLEISHTFGYFKESEAETEAVSTIALAGNFSLRLKSKSIISTYFVQDIKPGNYQFSCLIRGMTNSRWGVFIYPKGKGKEVPLRLSSVFIPQGSEPFRYSLKIPFEILRGYSHFKLMLILEYGEILIDNVRLDHLN